MEKTVVDILKTGVELGASDIHLTVFRPPIYRVDGKLTIPPGADVLTSEDVKRLGEEMIPNERYRKIFQEEGQVDFSNAVSGIGRFRVNLFMQRGSYAAAIRIIPIKVPQLSSLGLPPVVNELAKIEKGLILVTGTTGSGKSTTLAAIIDLLNHTRNLNIVTLEDPIEYLHRHGTCVINQREIGSDTASFALGLRAALRQDPDVILVGEMRDLETISIAITAAETGHLVLASLHSGSAAQTIERIIDVFPPHQQPQISIQLSTALQGVICQQLIPALNGKGRVVAAEVMVVTPAIRNLIRENKSHQIYSAIQTGAALGMVTMDKSIKSLYQQKKISYEEASRRLSVNETL